ncbi:unnamed protein product [Brassica napus]|uniref:(rape) hypothetical protein n=1 Tax=Brassica napus TaxID=3708 RepID=A0A816LBB7_BRANA|nr:unnamed protein product [Brassica napus]
MTIDVDAIEDDDDVVESTASAFDRVSSLLLLLLLLYPTITIHVCPLSCSSILALLSNTLFLQPQREHMWCLDDNMRPELPGFYFDEERRNILQLKVLSQVQNLLLLLQKQQNKSLNQSLSSVIALNNKKNKSNFKEEIEKTHASNPLVWRYDSTENIGDAALKEFQVDIQTSQGLTTKNILVGGSN